MSRRTYITERVVAGRRWAGPDIEADTWAEAEARAREIAPPGLTVIGKLVESIPVSGLVVGMA